MTASDDTSWKVAPTRAGVLGEVECNGAQEYGVPHAIDNDSHLAVRELYIEQGRQEDGVVAFTMYRLLEICGLDDSGANRRTMRESLERLSATPDWISGAWRSHDEWVAVGLRLIETEPTFSGAGGNSCAGGEPSGGQGAQYSGAAAQPMAAPAQARQVPPPGLGQPR